LDFYLSNLPNSVFENGNTAKKSKIRARPMGKKMKTFDTLFESECIQKLTMVNYRKKNLILA
jgi:hypothetical protein